MWIVSPSAKRKARPAAWKLWSFRLTKCISIRLSAAFNKNLLARINRELGGDIDLDAFAHRAVWNPAESRIEMHLVSLKDQTIHVRGQAFRFAEGETIHTENSYKFTIERMAALARAAGWKLERRWVSEDPAFGMVLLRA